MEVTKENCGKCEFFINNEFKYNMIRYNICHRRDGGACRDESSKF